MPSSLSADRMLPEDATKALAMHLRPFWPQRLLRNSKPGPGGSRPIKLAARPLSYFCPIIAYSMSLLQI